MEHIAHAAPVVKWVGGKRQLLPQILPLIPKRMTAYCEPFLGGGAVLFALQPKRALVNDLNQDLITVYRVIKEDADALIEHLSRHENTPEYFYRIRDLDRDKEAYAAMSDVEKASRLLYLNKTCYNGLFRVNASGAFNSPYGHYRRPNIVNEQTIRGVSRYFNSCDITFFSGDFASVLEQVPKGGFVYLDPPYDPVSDTASFTGYNRGGFGREEQVRLKECCDALTARGVKFLLSNSATPFIRELYGSYRVSIVQARRAVNSVASRRGAIEEVLVRNYGTQ
ncbi:MAG: DNA adenine methylase [Pseudoflavonifractor capillosus]|uniref:DNA adenine methylase n=1 Tax=Pseudoflavonifractor capillosus TaxID=106588 RepID=UPI0023F8AEB7|nr:DNA adenine methylase [Pseudoflavonifractor capillosus]MCI5929454.1 DNA adenine methylase [Pseudoflavonifractor capillosus]MDY4660100.1 DNA adenine methylase [Pseudoflavonifractor capillosus]